MDPKMIDRLIDLGYVQQTLAELVSIPSVNPPRAAAKKRRLGIWRSEWKSWVQTFL